MYLIVDENDKVVRQDTSEGMAIASAKSLAAGNTKTFRVVKVIATVATGVTVERHEQAEPSLPRRRDAPWLPPRGPTWGGPDMVLLSTN